MTLPPPVVRAAATRPGRPSPSGADVAGSRPARGAVLRRPHWADADGWEVLLSDSCARRIDRTGAPAARRALEALLAAVAVLRLPRLTARIGEESRPSGSASS